MIEIYKFWDFLGGRKFTVLLVGTSAMILGKLDAWHWVSLAIVYTGGNLAQDYIIEKFPPNYIYITGKLWNYLGGRKFMILAAATIALFIDKLESLHWLVIAGIYIGINIAQDYMFGKLTNPVAVINGSDS